MVGGFNKTPLTQVFSCEFCKIFKKRFFWRAPFFEEHLLWLSLFVESIYITVTYSISHKRDSLVRYFALRGINIHHCNIFYFVNIDISSWNLQRNKAINHIWKIHTQYYVFSVGKARLILINHVNCSLIHQACKFTKKDTLAQVLSCEFCEIFKNTFFYVTPLVAVSVLWQNFWKQYLWKTSLKCKSSVWNFWILFKHNFEYSDWIRGQLLHWFWTWRKLFSYLSIIFFY